MARFDIYPNPSAPERGHTPFILDVQNDHLGPMVTRVVIPLRTTKGFGPPARGLNPLIDVDGKTVVVDAAALAPVPAALLRKPVARANAWRNDVHDALDTLFGSY
jgi:toxin CcdB